MYLLKGRKLQESLVLFKHTYSYNQVFEVNTDDTYKYVYIGVIKTSNHINKLNLVILVVITRKKA